MKSGLNFDAVIGTIVVDETGREEDEGEGKRMKMSVCPERIRPKKDTDRERQVGRNIRSRV